MLVSKDFTYPTSIRFGAGRIAELAEACVEAGVTRPLLVTDRGLVHLEITRRCLALLEAKGLENQVFSDMGSDPDEEQLDKGIEALKRRKCDGVVAFGGGSALDLGKLVAFMAGQPLSVWEFEDAGDRWKRADASSVLPVVAVPTTAGTGSEVGRAGVLTDRRERVKKIIFHPKMMPRRVILDPELTRDMPPFITVGTGMDALVHSLEAFCSPHFHPLSQGIAVEGVKLVRENLEKVFRHPCDLEARGNMMLAASMGAVAFQKGLGAAHALSHQIGALFHTHHGMTNAVVIPYVLETNRRAVESKIASLAGYLGLKGGFEGFLDSLIRLRKALEVPDDLKGLLSLAGKDGEFEERFDAEAGDWIAKILQDPSMQGNPVAMDSAGVKSLLEKCHGGG